jgi:peroxiredoxin (alkyl hydroperoxide reductase subunit C)
MFLMKLLRLFAGLMLVVFFMAGLSVHAADPKAVESSKEAVDGCVEPAAGPIPENQAATAKAQTNAVSASPAIARVGSPAPNFEAPSYLNGSFKNIKLSDFKGKWVILCFYPGDFTFV